MRASHLFPLLPDVVARLLRNKGIVWERLCNESISCLLSLGWRWWRCLAVTRKTACMRNGCYTESEHIEDKIDMNCRKREAISNTSRARFNTKSFHKFSCMMKVWEVNVWKWCNSRICCMLIGDNPRSGPIDDSLMSFFKSLWPSALEHGGVWGVIKRQVCLRFTQLPHGWASSHCVQSIRVLVHQPCDRNCIITYLHFARFAVCTSRSGLRMLFSSSAGLAIWSKLGEEDAVRTIRFHQFKAAEVSATWLHGVYQVCNPFSKNRCQFLAALCECSYVGRFREQSHHPTGWRHTSPNRATRIPDRVGCG